MLNQIKNNKGATEGITWVVGLIAILLIVVLAIVVYSYGGLGKKTTVEIAIGKYGANDGKIDFALNFGTVDFYGMLAQQRLNGFYFARDMSGGNKGIIVGTTSGNVYRSNNDQSYVLLDSKRYYSLRENSNFKYCTGKHTNSNNCFYFNYKNYGYVLTRAWESRT
jgi:hypothetical protein